MGESLVTKALGGVKMAVGRRSGKGIQKSPEKSQHGRRGQRRGSKAAREVKGQPRTGAPNGGVQECDP